MRLPSGWQTDSAQDRLPWTMQRLAIMLTAGIFSQLGHLPFCCRVAQFGSYRTGSGEVSCLGCISMSCLLQFHLASALVGGRLLDVLGHHCARAFGLEWLGG